MTYAEQREEKLRSIPSAFLSEWECTSDRLRGDISLAEYWWHKGKQAGEQEAARTLHNDLKEMHRMLSEKLR